MPKFQFVLFVLVVILLFTGCSNDKNTKNSDITGKLIWPYLGTEYNEKGEIKRTDGIYEADLNKSLEEITLLYKNKSHYLKYPFKTRNGSIIYVSKSKNSNDVYEIIEVTNGVAKNLLLKEDSISFPVMLDNENILYLGINQNDQSYLGKYSLKDHQDQILEKNVDIESKPSVSDNGSILYTRVNEDSYWIVLKDSEGRNSKSINGCYPLWLEDNKKFIFYSDEKIKIYDITTGKSKTIVKSTFLNETPVLSPDKKYIAFYEADGVGLVGGELVNYLRIIPISGGKKINVKAFNNDDTDQGLEWIE